MRNSFGKDAMQLKALSVKQPYASMIAQGSKTIETRTWPTEYRGDLLIVSCKKPRIPGLPSGKALCIAKLVDCRPMLIEDKDPARCQWYRGAWSWVLEDIRKIQPFSVRGRLKLYDVEIEE